MLQATAGLRCGYKPNAIALLHLSPVDMSLKADLNVSVAVADFDAIAALADQKVYARFLSLCNRSATRILPPKVKWSGYSVARSADRVSVRLFKGDTETFRLSFVPPPASGS